MLKKQENKANSKMRPLGTREVGSMEGKMRSAYSMRRNHRGSECEPWERGKAKKAEFSRVLTRRSEIVIVGYKPRK